MTEHLDFLEELPVRAILDGEREPTPSRALT
jgi:hypothetical protein